jgi:hypothetical protein
VPANDERQHPPTDELLWNESWYFDFTTGDGTLGGYVRIGLYPNLGTVWYWGCLVGEGRPLVTVIDHEVPLPVAGSLELRTEGLWAEHTCETPLEHWSLGLEAFATAIDDPADVYGVATAADLRGDRVPLGFDLEWESATPAYPYPGVDRYEVSCDVHGEVLVGDERIAFDGHGQRDHSWGTRDWWAFGWVWTAGRLDDGTSFHATKVRIPDVTFEPGYVHRAEIGMVDPSGFAPSEELGADGLPTDASMVFGGHGDGGTVTLDVEPRHFAPVHLVAPDGRRGRFPRALCRFTDTAGGRTGHGWTEWNQPQG